MIKRILFLIICNMHIFSSGRIDEQRNTPLMQAIIGGNIAQAKMLIERNKSINECNASGKNALMIAVEYKQYELAQLLVRAGIHAQCVDMEGNSVLDFLCDAIAQKPHKIQACRTLKVLIDHGLLIHPVSVEWTPLMLACFNGDIKQVKLLLEQKVNPNICTSKGVTALLCAIEKREAQIVDLLLKNGATIDTRTHHSFDYIAWATIYGNPWVLRLLLFYARDASVDSINHAYGLATIFNYRFLIKIFRDYFPYLKSESIDQHETADIIFDSDNRMDGFDRAVANNDISMVRTLLTDRIDQVRMNQAVFLALNASNEMLSFLVAHHADVNTINNQGLTPLMVACNELNVPMVRSLLGNGAQAQLIVNGITALLCVIAHRAPLRSNNTNVSVGNALTEYQVQIAQAEIATLLLDHGAQPNGKTRRGHTILMEAVKTSCNVLIPVLLSAGANAEMTDREGNTALHHACMVRNENAIRILLSFGVNPKAMNVFGDTPLRLVKEHAKMSPRFKESMITLFKKHGVQ